MGHRHRADIVQRHFSFGERTFQHWHDLQEVLARRDLWDHASVPCVQRDLRRDDIRKNTHPVFDYSGRGLIA